MAWKLCRASAIAAVLGLVAGAAAAQPQPADRLIYGPGFFAPKRPVTAYDMILLLPGFTFEEGDAVRGYAGSASNVLIDGARPSAKLDTMSNVLSAIPASRVARIEIISGGAAGIDMQGRPVIANVVLRAKGAELAARGGVVIYGDGHVGKDFTVNWSHRDGDEAADADISTFNHQNPNSGKGRRILVEASGALDSDAAAKITEPTHGIDMSGGYQHPLLGGLLKFKAYAIYGTDQLQEEDHVAAGALGPHENFRSSEFRTRQGEASLDYTRPLWPRATLDVVALQSLEKAEDVGDAVEDGVAENTRAAGVQGESIGRAKLDYVAMPTLTLRGGGEYDFNFLNGRDVLIIGGEPVALPTADIRVTEGRGELFGEAAWTASPRLAIEGGVRVEASKLKVSRDAHNAASFMFVKPRLVATFTPIGEDQLRLRLERTVSQLDFQDFATVSTLDTGRITAGNPRLEPERDWILEASFEHHFWGSGALIATLSHGWLDRVIDQVPVDGFNAPGNIGSGRRETAMLDLTLPLEKLGLAGGQFKATGAWKYSRVTDPTTLRPRQITLDQPFSGSAALVNQVPRWKSSWRVDVADGYRQPTFLIDEVQRVRYATQTSFLWEYKPASDLVLQAQLQNLSSAERFRTRFIFAGLRSSGPLAQIERLSIRNGARVLFSVRKSF